MVNVYPILLSFFITFLAELGDKTQLLVLSFSTKTKTRNIILGITLGSFLSHGLAIMFGSEFFSLFSSNATFYLKMFTNLSFICLGIIGLIFQFINLSNLNIYKQSENIPSKKDKLISVISHLKLPSSILLAFLIFIGELGDKTFLSSIALSSSYPNFKFIIVLGATLGMVASNLLVMFFSKFISSYFNYAVIGFISNLAFIILGMLGLVSFC